MRADGNPDAPRTPWRRLTGFVERHERTLSAFAMVAGFIGDNFFFHRVDHANTQIVFVSYLALAAVSIAVLHVIETRAPRDAPRPRWHSFLPLATQFALGGLWSAFLIFYARSAVIAASWPFLLLLAAIFIGNEVLKAYHSRLVFTATLFFFALYSYAILTLPLLTHGIGIFTFIVAGIAAVLAFFVYLELLGALGRQRFERARMQIALGAGAVYLTVNIFYFTNLLPPLPLALTEANVFHAVRKTGADYRAVDEAQSWTARFGASSVMHVGPQDSLSVYSAVFAPVRFNTPILHRWQRYDDAAHHWVTQSSVPFTIQGGRDNGYRGYTTKTRPRPGAWRVDIVTDEGHLIGRVRFRVEAAAAPPVTREVVLH